ncbi:hypothetical protein [Bacillus cytotoxicus]|uniref:hypothetical protein n=1 Tax=Bacillus cytotoxicus TaxID=580165 RepID=UPI00244973FB|nr:hypothetical protein [Bacillus cytotoxicus]
MQFYIWSNTANEKYLLINSHHILTDAWTKNRLMDKIMKHYYNKAEEQKSDGNITSKASLVNDRKIRKFQAYCKEIEQLPNRIKPYQPIQELRTGFTQTFESDYASVERVVRFCAENKISVFSFI